MLDFPSMKQAAIDPTKRTDLPAPVDFEPRSLPDDYPVYLFNVTEHPADRWPYLAIIGLMALTVLLALFGLGRILWLRRRT